MNVGTTVAKAILELQRKEYDALSCFRPLPNDSQWHSQEEFIRCMATQVLLSGSNQSGKTTLNCVRTSAFALDRPVTLASGELVHVRKPIHHDKPVLIWFVGLQLNHVGDTLYPKLFLPGAFKLIRDPVTKRMRAWNPANEYDAAYEEKTVPAPPLIPESEFADKPAWYVRASHQIESVTLKNGAVLRFYASTAEAKQGDQVHLINVDEQIDNYRHYTEWLQRIGPVRGQIVWSTWPNVDPNEALVGLYELCERDREREKPRAAMFTLLQSDNPYYPKEMRDEIGSTGQMDEEEAKARIDGVFVLDKRRMYPSFSRRVHGLLAYDEKDDDELARVCRKDDQIPADWTRYLGLDPGTEHPCVMLIAVPPPKRFGDFIVVYKEIYGGRWTAEEIAKRVEAETKGQWFDAFVIDTRAGRQTPMSYGLSIADNYSRAFRAKHLRSRRSGSGFLWGNDKPMDRQMQMQAALNLRPSGSPQLRVWIDRCPNFVKQMESYRKAIDQKSKRILDEPAKKQTVDCVHAAEYVICTEPRYVAPQIVEVDAAAELFKEFSNFLGQQARQSQQVHCGPGVA